MSIKKDQYIEALRGIAILGVVFVHIIGSNPKIGLRVSDHSYLRLIDELLGWIRMPLFTVISGFVYAYLPVDFSKLKKFLQGKVRRLLLPLITVGTFSFLVQALVPGSNTELVVTDIWKVYLKGYNQFWYLIALFLVFLSVIVLEYYSFLTNPKTWIFVVIISCLQLFVYEYYFISTTYSHLFTFLAFDRFLYLLPFFLVGVGIKRFNYNKLTRHSLYAFVFVAITGLVIRYLSWSEIVSITNVRNGTLLGVTTGIAATVVLTNLRINSKWLMIIGGYSYPIFLLHYFGVTPTRIILQKFGIFNVELLVIFSLIMGIMISIILSIYFNRKPFLRMCILGGSRDKKIVFTQN